MIRPLEAGVNTAGTGLRRCEQQRAWGRPGCVDSRVADNTALEELTPARRVLHMDTQVIQAVGQPRLVSCGRLLALQFVPDSTPRVQR